MPIIKLLLEPDGFLLFYLSCRGFLYRLDPKYPNEHLSAIVLYI